MRSLVVVGLITSAAFLSPRVIGSKSAVGAVDREDRRCFVLR